MQKTDLTQPSGKGSREKIHEPDHNACDFSRRDSYPYNEKERTLESVTSGTTVAWCTGEEIDASNVRTSWEVTP